MGRNSKPPPSNRSPVPLPSEYMRGRRPHLFSDTQTKQKPIIAREVLDHHLETLTSRKQEIEFEYFARRLAERTICPNLRPQTGPTGGGDSKVDSETYPVSDEISKRWYEGDPAGGRERWAFAFSTKKRWSEKVRHDVKSIVDTGRDYGLIYFITSRYTRERDRARIEDELSKSAGIPVKILDRTWIIEQVFDRGLAHLAIEALGMTDVREKRSDSAGPLDTERLAELTTLDSQIADATRYQHTPYALAEDALRAALLARGLGRSRTEIDGRFAQARRVAEQAGSKQQQAKIYYDHAWTTYFWFDDFPEFIKLLDRVEALTLGSDNASDLERVATLYSLARFAVASEFLTEADANTAARRARVVGQLERISKIQARPTNALEARTCLLILRAGEAPFGSDPVPALDEIWTELREVLSEAQGLAGFDVERIFRLISEMGPHVPESELFDALFEEMVQILERRKSEGEGGKAYVERAFQKLEKGLYYDAIRYFGRASERLFVKEYEGDLALALIGSSYAYEAVGLHWAARNYALAAATHGVSALEESGSIGPYVWRPFNRLALAELKLGRVPQFLAAYELQMILWSQGAVTERQLDRMAEERFEYDVLLGSALLATRFADLPGISKLPDALPRLDLSQSRTALLQALGHEGTLRAEELIPESETEQSVSKFFEDWEAQRKKYELPIPEFGLSDILEFKSIVIGCEVSVAASNSPIAVAIAESLLGALESLLSTSIEHRMMPQVDRFKVVLRESGELTGLPVLSFETVNGVQQAVISHGPKLDFDSREDLEAYPEWLSRTVLELAMTVFAIADLERWAEQILGEERGFSRAITFSNVPLMTERVFGREPKNSIADWVADEDKSYSLERAEPLFPATEPGHKELKVGEGEPSPEMFDLSRLRHSDMRVMSLIDTRRWDEARWSGVFFQYTDDVETYPPMLGLMFRNRKAAQDIFAALVARLGSVDEQKALRVAIVRGISAANPSHYAVVIGPQLDDATLVSGTQFLCVSRINRMTPETSENLDNFLEVYRRSGRYLLGPAVIEDLRGVPEFLIDSLVGKYELEVREAWMIGTNDPDIMTLDPDDPPVIPESTVDAPVLDALERLRKMREGKQ